MEKLLDLRFGKNIAIQEAQCVGRKEVGGENLGQGCLLSHYRALRVYQKNTVSCSVLWSCKDNKRFRWSDKSQTTGASKVPRADFRGNLRRLEEEAAEQATSNIPRYRRLDQGGQGFSFFWDLPSLDGEVWRRLGEPRALVLPSSEHHRIYQ